MAPTQQRHLNIVVHFKLKIFPHFVNCEVDQEAKMVTRFSQGVISRVCIISDFKYSVYLSRYTYGCVVVSKHSLSLVFRKQASSIMLE